MLTHSGWCQCSDLIRKGNELQQTYKQGSAPRAKAKFSLWHLGTSTAHSQTATWLEITQIPSNLMKKATVEAKKGWFSSFMLNC